MTDENPFELWSNDLSAPKEEELHVVQDLFTEIRDEHGKTRVVVTPSFNARMMAATIGGQYQALLDVHNDQGQQVFNQDQALKIVLKTMSAVVIHTGDDDDDDE